MRLRWMVTRSSVADVQVARIAESMSMAQRPSRVRPQPLMSLSSITTFVTFGEMRIASCFAPLNVRPRTITYDALTVTLWVATFAASSVAPDAPWYTTYPFAFPPWVMLSVALPVFTVTVLATGSALAQVLNEVARDAAWPGRFSST